MSEEEPFYKPNKKPVPPREPVPGEEVWRLTDGGGRVQACELRDNSRAGAGWEIAILEAGEILVSRQCANEAEARFVANNARKDLLRTGWAESERKAIEKGDGGPYG